VFLILKKAKGCVRINIEIYNILNSFKESGGDYVEN